MTRERLTARNRVALIVTQARHNEIDALEAADAILALSTGADVPEGWALVPREPTEAMLRAAFMAMNATPSGTWKRMKAENTSPRRIFDVKMAPRYRAMIAAAPPPPEQKEGER